MLDAGIMASPYTIIPVNILNDGVATGTDGSAINDQVSLRDITCYMLMV